MTRKEAAERIKAILEECTEYEDSVCYVISDDADALNTAIKALKQEPCEDCISRQAAIDALADYIHNVDKVIGTGHLSAEDCKDAATSVLEELPSAKEKPFKLPEIYVADGYDTVMGEDGNVGFGVYVPDEKQIYIAGDVDNEVRLKALFHELCHWAQDMCGRSFDEDEANEFSDIVYDALPSAQPERTCVNCGRTANNGGWYADGRTRCPIEEHYALPKDGFCHLWEKRNITDDDYQERRTDE